MSFFRCMGSEWVMSTVMATFEYDNAAAAAAAAAAATAQSLPSCPNLCDPVDGSPPGTPVPGVLQAGTLRWVPISFSEA